MPVAELLVKGELGLGAKEAQWFQKGEAAHGKERWQLIEQALREPVTLLAFLNPFRELEVQADLRQSQQLTEHEEIPQLFSCPASPPSEPSAAALRAMATVLDEDEGTLPRPGPELPCCFVSGASALAAQALAVAPGEAVLDLCAGPGAKALLVASALFAGDNAGGRLVCNEPARPRAVLLKQLLAAWMPPELLRSGVVFSGCEASHKPAPELKRLGPFDKVLVDVPCCSLRRVAKQQRVKVGGHLNLVSPAMWECNPRTVKANAELAEELLRCAAELVRPGGLVVYCTTSIEERENDGVVKKFLQRMRDGFRVEPGEDDSPIGGAECTELGTMLLPDQGTLHGPLYFARLRRL